MYNNSKQIDADAKCKGDDAVTKGVWSFADRYEVYAEERFAGTSAHSINPVTKKASGDIIARLTTSLGNAKAPTGDTAAVTKLANFKARFTKLKTAAYEVSISWDFSSFKTKRDEEVKSCVRPTLTTSSEISSFTTSVITTSKEEEEPPTTTTTKEEPSVPTTPLTRQEVICHKESDFPGHGDIQGGDQDKWSTEFSGLSGPNGNDELSDGSPKIELDKKDKHGITYHYEVEYVKGCVTTKSSQDFRFPLGLGSQVTAYLAVREPYTKCNNGGVGGTNQVGCLKYTFTGGK